MVSSGKDSSCYRWNQRNRVRFSLLSLSLAFYFQLHEKKFAVFIPSPSLVLRQTDGCFMFVCIYVYRYAIVEELAGLGATVHTCCRNEAELSKCLQEWEAKGFRVTGSICDLLSRPQREELINKVSGQFNGKLDIFVSPPFPD
jgi:hypothetical protein